MHKRYEDSVLSKVSLDVPGLAGQSIEISFEEVTPKMAERWLNTNSEKQRKLNVALVRQFTNQMRKGLWFGDNGETIKFSKSGGLIDGQHRLNSVVKHGEPVVLMIMRGINDEHIRHMDLGKKRNLADVFKVENIELPKGFTEPMLSSVISGIYVVKQYACITHSSESRSLRVDAKSSKTNPSAIELYEFLVNNPEIMDRLSKLKDYKIPTVAKSAAISPSIVGWFVSDIVDEDIAGKILRTFEECVPQTESGRNCPAFMMFKHIQKHRAQQITINKHQYPGLWLWATDNMIMETSPKMVKIGRSHMPGQGHERSKELVEYFKGLKETK
tara:strand:+ start:2875 stop:3861 length:987 start_codon:yes stop_codon:yes gene_type:complete